MVGADYEARLSKTLLPRVKAAQLQRLADACRIDQSCVIKAIAHKKCAGTHSPPPLMYTSMQAREHEQIAVSESGPIQSKYAAGPCVLFHVSISL